MLNAQADRLNNILEKTVPAVLALLSERGKNMFWPAEGILKQAAEAKNTKLNATVGIATRDDGQALTTDSLLKEFSGNLEIFRDAPSFGIRPLRERWREEMLRKNPSLDGTKITLPIVTAALTHGLTVATSLLADPGDSIILPDKFWGNYKLVFEHGFGVKLHPFNFLKKESFDLESFEKTIKTTDGKKIVLLNTPNNPTGYSPTVGEAEEIFEILKRAAEKSPITVICDDAYWGLVFEDGIQKESMFARLANLHPNLLAVKIDGATKEEFAWGLRVGFITFGNSKMCSQAADALEQKIGGTIRGQVSNCSHPSQIAILNALNSSTYEQEKLKNFELLKKRAQKCREILEENTEKFSPFFAPLPFNSGYFMCIELAEEFSAEAVRQELLKKFDTGVIATGQLLRIAFSSVAEKNLAQIFENIFEACKNLSAKSEPPQTSLF